MLQSIRRWQRAILDFVVSRHPRLGLDQRAENFVALFEKDLPCQSRVLDIGGGWGFYRQPLVSRGHECLVLDVVRPSMQKCPVVLYDGDVMPFPDKSFDVSMFITVLHHIADVKEIIRECRRVTRKRVVVVEDLYHHFWGRLWTVLRDQLYNFEFFGHPQQFRKKAEWIELFASHGFKLVKETQVYTWLSGLRILNGVFVFDVDPVQEGVYEGSGNDRSGNAG
jgi:ubiquinone/menaquinone biosynthesis C-methylase UbiE